MGYRSDFMLFRIAYRTVVEPPLILGGLVFAAGFLYARLERRPWTMPKPQSSCGPSSELACEA